MGPASSTFPNIVYWAFLTGPGKSAKPRPFNIIDLTLPELDIQSVNVMITTGIWFCFSWWKPSFSQYYPFWKSSKCLTFFKGTGLETSLISKSPTQGCLCRLLTWSQEAWTAFACHGSNHILTWINAHEWKKYGQLRSHTCERIKLLTIRWKWTRKERGLLFFAASNSWKVRIRCWNQDAN